MYLKPTRPRTRATVLASLLAGLSALAVPQSTLAADADSAGQPSVAVAGARQNQGQPRLVFAQKHLEFLGDAYQQALHNLLGINTIPADLKKHNRTGFLAGEAPKLIRAGGDYQDPWTRDASVNSWNAASLLCPEVARNTLWSVCERLPGGKLIVQRDNQWWDKLIWVTAAWNHYATTGDTRFLGAAHEASEQSLEEMLKTRFDREFGLFQGPSHLADGIAGYPEPFDDPKGSSSFILDHPGGDKMMTLSANCIYYQAFRSAANMALALGKGPATADRWNQSAAELKMSINRRLWMPDQGTYAYFLHGTGELRGKPARYQEATGISLAILFGIADRDQVQQIIRNVRPTRFGLPLVDPDLARYSADKPGRHGRIVWPMAQGYWATAAARAGQTEMFRKEVEALAGMVKDSGWNFFEIYSPATGQPDGGWQCGVHWASCRHQTWSATAYIRMVHYGLFGMAFEPEGIRFSPTLPGGWKGARLEGLKYRRMTLDVQLTGQGQRVTSFVLDGKASATKSVPATLTGAHTVTLTLADH